VLDKVRVLWAGHFKKFLKIIFGQQHLAFEVAFGRCYTLLAWVTGSLIIVTIDAIAGYYDDVMGSSLLPFVAAIGAFPSALNGGLGWYGSATTGGCFRVAWDEGSQSS
jgi:hypothetical protein